MRLIISLSIILALFIALGFWTNHTLNTTAQEFSKRIDDITDLVENQDWLKAEQQIIALEEEWSKKANWWPVMLDHQEIDNIDFAFAKLKKYASTEDNTLTLGLLSELKMMLQHISEKEAVNIKNIL